MKIERCAWRMMLLLSAALAMALSAECGFAANDGVRTGRAWPERAGTPLSVSAIFGVTEIGGVSIAPGGDQVAFTTSSADASCNCYHVSLNLLDLATRRVQVVADLGQALPVSDPDGTFNGDPTAPESLWSKDGHYLAYLVNQGGHGALFAYDAHMHVSKKLDLHGDEPFGFTWDGSSDSLIYETGGPTRSSLEMLRQGSREGYLFGQEFRAEPDAGVPVIPRIPASPYLAKGYSQIGESGTTWSDLKVISVPEGVIREATSSERSLVPHGDFAFLYQPHQESTTIESNDGRFTLALGQPDISYSGPPVTITQRTGNGERTINRTSAEICPGERLRRGAVAAYWNDMDDDFVVICTNSGIGWPDLVLGQRGYVVSVSPRNGMAKAILTIGGAISEGEFGRRCDVSGIWMICEEEEPSEPPALFLLDLRARTSKVVFDPNGALRKEHFPRVQQLVQIDSAGQRTVADLVYPLDYVSGRRYPLVLTQYWSRGFLQGNTGNENPIFGYAKAGFFVLSASDSEPPRNKRPKKSVLERFKASMWHSHDLREIQGSLDAITEHLVRGGLVDDTKIAYTGLSHGANQIDYALANGRKLAAVITSTCCTQPYFWINSPPLNPLYYQLTGNEPPAVGGDLTVWSMISPILHLSDIHTAILANVGEHEGLGFRGLWTLMRQAHKPMEAYIYAGEWHVKFQPAHLAAIQNRNIDWLRFWLQGYVDPSPAKAAQYARWEQMCKDWQRHDPRAIKVPNSCGTRSRRL